MLYFPVPLSLLNHYCSTSLFHLDCSTITVPLHWSTLTVPPLLFHFTPSPWVFHHYCSTSLFHFDCSTSNVPPLMFHFTVPPWLLHHYCSKSLFNLDGSTFTVPLHSSTLTVLTLLFHLDCSTITVPLHCSTLTVPTLLFHFTVSPWPISKVVHSYRLSCISLCSLILQLLNRVKSFGGHSGSVEGWVAKLALLCHFAGVSPSWSPEGLSE